MHLSGEWILLIFLVLVTAARLLLLHLTQLGLILHANLPDRPHRRMFLASISFFITFLAVRLMVASIQYHIGPFQYVTMGGRHIHHLVWGILILLGVGLGYMNELGSRGTPISIFASRLMAILYGVGAALTLDEFALWLNLAKSIGQPRGGRVSTPWCFSEVCWQSEPGVRRCSPPSCERNSLSPCSDIDRAGCWRSPNAVTSAVRRAQIRLHPSSCF
jgi:hypothetical protein